MVDNVQAKNCISESVLWVFFKYLLMNETNIYHTLSRGDKDKQNMALNPRNSQIL